MFFGLVCFLVWFVFGCLGLGSYRSRLDIIADMLRVAQGKGARKTRVMYQANLSYRLLKKYLGEVLEACLLRFERKTRCYVLTSKGKLFLEKYKRYTRRNKRLEERLHDLDNERETLEELCSNG